MKFAYSITRNTPNYVWLEDLSEQMGCMSVTNAAEAVIKDLLTREIISSGKRVFYTDTAGNVDELVHDGVKFISFAPGMCL